MRAVGSPSHKHKTQMGAHQSAPGLAWDAARTADVAALVELHEAAPGRHWEWPDAERLRGCVALQGAGGEFLLLRWEGNVLPSGIACLQRFMRGMQAAAPGDWGHAPNLSYSAMFWTGGDAAPTLPSGGDGNGHMAQVARFKWIDYDPSTTRLAARTGEHCDANGAYVRMMTKWSADGERVVLAIEAVGMQAVKTELFSYMARGLHPGVPIEYVERFDDKALERCAPARALGAAHMGAPSMSAGPHTCPPHPTHARDARKHTRTHAHVRDAHTWQVPRVQEPEVWGW